LAVRPGGAAFQPPNPAAGKPPIRRTTTPSGSQQPDDTLNRKCLEGAALSAPFYLTADWQMHPRKFDRLLAASHFAVS